MRYFLLCLGLFALSLSAFASEADYPRDIAQWKEIAVPPASDAAARMAWYYAGNYSRHSWRVESDDGQVSAQLAHEKPNVAGDRPPFDTTAGGFRGASSFLRVEDGWLVGFNKGEFGAAIYWFSEDGAASYQVSNHQVKDFITRPDGVYAIEGLAHMMTSSGSIIRLGRSTSDARWKASTAAELPFAPYAVSMSRDGTMLITLSDAIVAVDSEMNITTLLADAPWSGLYPKSSALSAEEKKLYIGMRQFVGEFDIESRTLRMLVPSDAFLNKLPQEVQQRIRQQYVR